MSSPYSLRQSIEQIVRGERQSGLHAYITQLGVADRRTASTILADAQTWLTVDEARFWHLFAQLCTLSAKAYLGTLLKAATALHKRRRLGFDHAELTSFCQERATHIDLRKMREALLPLADTPQTLTQLATLLRMDQEDEATQAMTYFRIDTPPAAYALFQALRRLDHRPELIHRYAVELIKRGDRRSFALAAILRAYFGIERLPATFASEVPPFRLSALETDFDAFHQLLTH